MFLRYLKMEILKILLKYPKTFWPKALKNPVITALLKVLAVSHDNKGVLGSNGTAVRNRWSKAKLYPTKSPVRITYFDKKTRTATKQFPYRLERIAKIPWLYFAVNGVTDLLEYAPDKFLVLERGFAAGHGKKEIQ